MSNLITIELCAEDRARIDRLTAALEARACDKCVAAAMSYKAAVAAEAKQEEAPQESLGDAAEASKAETPTTTPAEAERPAQKETAAPAAASVAEVQKKVIELATKGPEWKAKVRDIVKQYAERVQLIPEDKLGEVLTKLNELGE